MYRTGFILEKLISTGGQKYCYSALKHILTEDIMNNPTIEKKFINSLVEDELKLILSINGALIESLPMARQSKELCEIAIKETVYAIEYIANKTDDLIKLAIRLNASIAFECVDITDSDLLEYAILLDPANIQYIDNPSKELCQFALTINPEVLKFIDNPTSDILTFAKGIRCAIEFTMNESI